MSKETVYASAKQSIEQEDRFIMVSVDKDGKGGIYSYIADISNDHFTVLMSAMLKYYSSSMDNRNKRAAAEYILSTIKE